MIPDCRWTRPRIIAYLDGELEEPDEELISEHMSACPACRSVAEAERALTARVRAAAGAERAPEGLAERVRRSLAQARAEMEAEAAGRPEPSPAPAPALSPTASPAPVAAAAAVPESLRRMVLPRRAVGWSLAMASAAALLLIVGAMAFWPGSGRSLVNAMAEEHSRHSTGRMPRFVDLTSDDSAAIEAYLAGRLGMNIKLPSSAFPATHGATCCRTGKRDMGLVACFCERRSHPISLFVVRSDGLDLGGLDRVESGGRDFWRGSAGGCRAVLWKSGPACYALVGEFKDQADHMDLARRTAQAVDVRLEE